MRDEASLGRLIEMGIDVYVPRLAASIRSEPAQAASMRDETATAASRAHARPCVALVARAEDAREEALLEQARRALALARVDASIESDVMRIGADVAGLVVFGKTFARQTGAALPAERARNVQWIATAELARIVGDAKAKRALWSELRRMVRALARRTG